MDIVAAMRISKTIMLALLAALLAVGLSTPASATPVVDQYTEQLPTPGGPNPMDPGSPGSNDTLSPANGDNGAVEDSTYVNSDGEVVTSEEDGATATPNRNHGDGAARAGSEDENEIGAAVVTTSDDDGDGGMGWLFPASLILIAGVIAGIAISRRNRGNLAI